VKSAGRGIVGAKSFEVSSLIKKEVQSLQSAIDSHDDKYHQVQLKIEEENNYFKLLEGSELLLTNSLEQTKSKTVSNDTQHLDNILSQHQKNLSQVQDQKNKSRKTIEEFERELSKLKETKEKNLQEIKKKKRRNHSTT
jgi:chromosome segregation ATPase